MAERIASYRDLRVYQNAIDVAMQVFEISKSFPKSEQYSLTDQIRRSSRSVCANLAEAWRKRRYKAAFIAKLSDAEAEAGETQVWLDLGCRCGYLSKSDEEALDQRIEEILGQLVKMINEADKWLIRP